MVSGLPDVKATACSSAMKPMLGAERSVGRRFVRRRPRPYSPALVGSDSPFPAGQAPAPKAVPLPPVPTFEFHPGLAGRQPEAYELAEQLRRLINLSVSTA